MGSIRSSTDKFPDSRRQETEEILGMNTLVETSGDVAIVSDDSDVADDYVLVEGVDSEHFVTDSESEDEDS